MSWYEKLIAWITTIYLTSMVVFMMPVFITWGEYGLTWAWFRISLVIGTVIVLAANKDEL